MEANRRSRGCGHDRWLLMADASQNAPHKPADFIVESTKRLEGENFPLEKRSMKLISCCGINGRPEINQGFLLVGQSLVGDYQ